MLSTSAGLTVYVSVQMFQRRLRVLDDSDDDDEESQRRARNRQLVDESTVSELQLDRQQTSAMGMTFIILLPLLLLHPFNCHGYDFILLLHRVCKPDSEILKKCMVYEVEGPRPRGRPKRTRREVVEKDCIAPKLNKDDTVNRNKRRKLIKDV